MPIVEPVDTTEPIGQGDLLKGVPLYTSRYREGNDDPWRSSRVGKAVAGLVLSRTCALEHKTVFTVSMVKRCADKIPKSISTLEDARDWLTALRDGEQQPDRFYLGHIPELGDGRYMAHLDSLHVITKPDDMSAFLLTHRVARLSHNFIRDLHTRLFTAFSREGFNDYRWFSDTDLRWLVELERKELTEKQLILSKLKVELSQKKADGLNIGTLEENIQKMEEALQKRPSPPELEAELAARQDSKKK